MEKECFNWVEWYQRFSRFFPAKPQELDVDMFSLLVYLLRSRGKDGHFADAQIVFWVNYTVIIQVTISCVYHLNKQLHALSSALYQKFSTFTVLLSLCFFCEI